MNPRNWKVIGIPELEVSRFRELVRPVHGYREEMNMLAPLHAYMDESSDKGRRIFAVGGFVGRSDQWSDLLYRWIDRLQPSNLPNPIKAFHMTDCENGGGEFRDEFGWDQDSRRQLIIDLIGIICDYDLAMFGMGMKLGEYNSLDRVHKGGLKVGRNEYCFLAQSVMVEIAMELEEDGCAGHEDVAFFFDRNLPHEHWTNEIHKNIQGLDRPWARRIGSLTFDGKERLRLLQAGDIGAYESMKYITNEIYQEGRTRKSFQRLKEAGRIHKLMDFTEENLNEIVRLKKEEISEQIKESRKRKKQT